MGITYGDDKQQQSTTPEIGNNVDNQTASLMFQNGMGGEVLGRGLDFTLLTGTAAGESLTALQKAFEEAYKNVHQSLKPDVQLLDNQIVSNLGYSCFVVSFKAPGSKRVPYFTILMGGTGVRPYTVKQICDEIAAIERSKTNGRLKFTTPDDAFDADLFTVVLQHLKSYYADETLDFITIDGMVIPYDVVITPDVGNNIAALAYNQLHTDNALSSNKFADLRVGEIRRENEQLRAEALIAKGDTGTGLDVLKQPVRTDWSLSLAAHNMNQEQVSLNKANVSSKLVNVGGYVEMMPVNVPMQVMGPNGPVTTNRYQFAPNIIITSINGKYPSVGYLDLGILTALIMTNADMYIPTLLPKLNHNTGALNVIANVNNEPNGVGSILDLTGKDVTVDTQYQYIKSLFTQMPVVSIDVQSYGPDSAFTSILLSCVSENPTARQNAATEFIRSLSVLTNGAFPANYDINKIFVGNGSFIPLGRWNSAKGSKDLRDVDLSMVLSVTKGDVHAAYEWSNSLLPREFSPVDPFTTKIKVIDKVIDDVEITGKATRLTFHPELIQTLALAANNSGLNISYKPEVVFGETLGFGAVGSFFNIAGIQGASSPFAKQYLGGNNNQAFYNPFVMNGVRY